MKQFRFKLPVYRLPRPSEFFILYCALVFDSPTMLERSGLFTRLSIIFLFILGITLYEWNTITSELRDQLLHLEHDAPVVETDVDPEAYREVYSNSTADGKYFLVDFLDQKSINPNIIPHPYLKDTWIVTAQRHEVAAKDPRYFAELVCNAAFENGTLKCLEKSVNMPVAPTSSDNCTGDLAFFNFSNGPHDARVFYGPEVAYTVFGTQSKFTCFGQVVQDFGLLMGWENADIPNTWFKEATDLQRPPPYGAIEKNWFLFWDQDGQVYSHYDIWPKRVFGKLGVDGSVGKDLAPQAGLNDDKCMGKYMPRVGPDLESIHQATNSLSVTICKRSDPACIPSQTNTFIFAIFQFKSFYRFHSNYQPYIMLFEQNEPFEIHGISRKPFWIHGRRKPNEREDRNALTKENLKEGEGTDQAEMIYITSMSWKAHGQKYHGYIDDVVFLAFGIEDSQSAGIDVVVGDLLMDIGLCNDL